MTALLTKTTTHRPTPPPPPPTAQTPIAYLINQYPQPSHTFIRREIAALEAIGLTVERFTLRPNTTPLPDPADESERQRTHAILDAGPLKLLASLLTTAATRPLAFLRAARQALRLGLRSDRGLPIHAIYLAEACLLRIKLATRKVRHLHAHFGTNATTVALLCQTLGGPPFSFTAHGPEEFDAPLGLALNEKVRGAAFVIAVSDFGRSQLCRWADFADWPKIHVIRCGVDANFLTPEPTPVPETSKLVCVGRLSEQKGQLNLIHAAAILRDQNIPFHLNLIGDGPLRPILEQAITNLRLESRTTLKGTLPGPTIRQEILESRAFVLPSFAEGLPVAIMEALALGRPVLSTYVAGIPELVEPHQSGWLVPAGSVPALAEALATLLKTPTNILTRMGQHGANQVANRHDAQTEATKLANLIQPNPTVRATSPALPVD